MLLSEVALKSAASLQDVWDIGEAYDRHEKGRIMGGDGLRFDELREVNVERCEKHYHPLDDWSLMDWLGCVTGELGELAADIKALRRVNIGARPGPPPSVQRVPIGSEAADVVIYLDLLCARAGVDLGAAVRRKFNLVSEERIGPDAPTLPPWVYGNRVDQFIVDDVGVTPPEKLEAMRAFGKDVVERVRTENREALDAALANDVEGNWKSKLPKPEVAPEDAGDLVIMSERLAKIALDTILGEWDPQQAMPKKVIRRFQLALAKWLSQ